MDIILGMSFLILSNIEVNFTDEELSWRLYIIVEVFSITKQVKSIGKEKFAAVALDPENEIFVVHVTALASFNSDVYFFDRAQIVFLRIDKASTAVLNEYANFVDIFLPDLATELLEYTGINNYAIYLIDIKQLPHGPIYSLWPIELEILKIYIKTKLANGFIKPSRSLSSAPILFIWKLDGSLRLCVNY